MKFKYIEFLNNFNIFFIYLIDDLYKPISLPCVTIVGSDQYTIKFSFLAIVFIQKSIGKFILYINVKLFIILIAHFLLII